MAQIGLLILMVVVVRNGIVMVERVDQHREAGLTREHALLQAGDDRPRPIIMTAASTIVGLPPLAIGRRPLLGLSYYPLARDVIGDLRAATVLTPIVPSFACTLIEDAGSTREGTVKTRSGRRTHLLQEVLPPHLADESDEACDLLSQVKRLKPVASWG